MACCKPIVPSPQNRYASFIEHEGEPSRKSTGGLFIMRRRADRTYILGGEDGILARLVYEYQIPDSVSRSGQDEATRSRET